MYFDSITTPGSDTVVHSDPFNENAITLTKRMWIWKSYEGLRSWNGISCQLNLSFLGGFIRTCATVILILINNYLNKPINKDETRRAYILALIIKYSSYYMFYFKPWIIVSFYFRNLIVDVLLEETWIKRHYQYSNEMRLVCILGFQLHVELCICRHR